PRSEHMLHHLLWERYQIFDPVPVEALKTTLDVDFRGTDKTGLHRVSGMDDRGGHSSPNPQLPRGRIGGHLTGREERVVQRAILDPEVQRDAELVRVRTLALEDQTDLLLAPLEWVQAGRDCRQLLFRRSPTGFQFLEGAMGCG